MSVLISPLLCSKLDDVFDLHFLSFTFTPAQNLSFCYKTRIIAMSTVEIQRVLANAPTVQDLVSWNINWMFNLGLFGDSHSFSARDFDISKFQINSDANAEHANTVSSCMKSLIEDWELEGAQIEASKMYDNIRRNATSVMDNFLLSMLGTKGVDVDAVQGTRGVMIHKLAQSLQAKVDKSAKPPPKLIEVQVVIAADYQGLSHSTKNLKMEKAFLPVNLTWDEAKTRLSGIHVRFNEHGVMESSSKMGHWKYFLTGSDGASIRLETAADLKTEGDWRMMMTRLEMQTGDKVSAVLAQVSSVFLNSRDICQHETLTMEQASLEEFWRRGQIQEEADGMDLDMVDDNGDSLVTAINWKTFVFKEIDAMETEALNHGPPPPPAPPLPTTPSNLSLSNFTNLHTKGSDWKLVGDSVFGDPMFETPNERAAQKSSKQDVGTGGMLIFRPRLIRYQPTLIAPIGKIPPRPKEAAKPSFRVRKRNNSHVPEPQANLQPGVLFRSFTKEPCQSYLERRRTRRLEAQAQAARKGHGPDPILPLLAAAREQSERQALAIEALSIQAPQTFVLSDAYSQAPRAVYNPLGRNEPGNIASNPTTAGVIAALGEGAHIPSGHSQPQLGD